MAYIKYFENGGKNMSFLIKDDEVWKKYNEIWNVIKNKHFKHFKQPLSFIASLFAKKKYLKAKVREFDGSIRTNFLGNSVPQENMHYTCIA